MLFVGGRRKLAPEIDQHARPCSATTALGSEWMYSPCPITGTCLGIRTQCPRETARKSLFFFVPHSYSWNCSMHALGRRVVAKVGRRCPAIGSESGTFAAGPAEKATWLLAMMLKGSRDALFGLTFNDEQAIRRPSLQCEVQIAAVRSAVP